MKRALAPLLSGALLLGASAARADDSDRWLGPDKALHFAASAGVTGAGYGFSAIGAEDIRVRIAFGAGAGILAGAAKEIFDLAGFGTPSWKDLTWDVLGVAVGIGISVSIDLAVRALSPQRAVPR